MQINEQSHPGCFSPLRELQTLRQCVISSCPDSNASDVGTMGGKDGLERLLCTTIRVVYALTFNDEKGRDVRTMELKRGCQHPKDRE